MLTRCNHIVLNYNIRPLLRSSLIVGLLALSLLGSGCLYRIDIQQGNIIDSEQLTNLKQGMTQEQVRYILGSPLLQDVFHAQRWDYYYSLKPNQGEFSEHKLQLYFKAGRLQKIVGDASLDIPELAPLEQDSQSQTLPLL